MSKTQPAHVTIITTIVRMTDTLRSRDSHTHYTFAGGVDNDRVIDFVRYMMETTYPIEQIPGMILALSEVLARYKVKAAHEYRLPKVLEGAIEELRSRLGDEDRRVNSD